MSTPFFGRRSIHLDRTGFKPPHLFSKIHTRGRVWQKIAALIPLIIISCAAQGWPAGRAISLAVSGALMAEFLGAWIFQREPAYHDGESVFIGLFCALVLPLTLSIWIFFAAAFLAVFVGREIFGGFGQALVFPPALGLIILFFAAPQMIQAFDFKEARALSSTLLKSDQGQWNLVDGLFYPASAAPEDVSLLALALGIAVLLGCGLVRWELPFLCLVGVGGLRLWLDPRDSLFLFSGGFWLSLFWGLTHTSSLPLKPVGRWIYAFLAGLFAAVCPLGDEALRMLTGLAAASLISPWLDAVLTLKRSQTTGAG